MNENTSTTPGARTEVQTPQYRPTLAFYRANPKGSGSALKLELHPAHGPVDGSIMATMANQRTVGDRRGPKPTYATFNWEQAICVKLDFNDLTQILQVLRGKAESLCDGKGLYHATARHSTRICLRHCIEPYSGYSLDLYRKPNEGDEIHSHILLSASEAYGLAAAVEGSLGVVCFGIPAVIPHDTTAYRSEARRMRDAPAA